MARLTPEDDGETSGLLTATASSPGSSRLGRWFSGSSRGTPPKREHVCLYSLDSPYHDSDDVLLKKHFGDSALAPSYDDGDEASRRPSLGAAVWAGMKQNLVPGLVVLAVGIVVVGSYYLYPPARTAFNRVAVFREQTGFLFSALSTAFFGGVMPFLIIRLKESTTRRRKRSTNRSFEMEASGAWDGVSDSLPAKKHGIVLADSADDAKQGQSRALTTDETGQDDDDEKPSREPSARMTLAQLVFYAVWFGYKGVEVDLVYKLQEWIFGEGTDVGTIVIKVIVDQFGYNPVWAAPTNTIAFMWKDCDFSIKKLSAEVGWDFITYRVPSVLVSTWMVWVPAVSLVYSLPSSLQIPLFNLVLCFYVLILSFVVTKGSSSPR